MATCRSILKWQHAGQSDRIWQRAGQSYVIWQRAGQFSNGNVPVSHMEYGNVPVSQIEYGNVLVNSQMATCRSILKLQRAGQSDRIWQRAGQSYGI